MAEPEDSEAWVLDPFHRSLDVAWASEGDEWLQRLHDELAAHAKIEGHTMGPGSFPGLRSHVKLEVKSDAVSGTWLLIFLGEAGIDVLIAGSGEPASATLNRWTTALLAAEARVGQGHAAHDWRAIIAAPGHGLASEATIGVLKLSPWDHGFPYEPDSTSRRLLPRMKSHLYAWPIKVIGSTVAFSIDAALERAVEQLYRMCALLSALTGMLWEVEHDPTPAVRPWNELLERAQHLGAAFAVGEAPPEPILLDPPSWLGRAWETLAADDTLDRALSIQYEGMRLERQHPSFALIAFVSAIETIGEALAPLSVCKKCGSKTGSMRRFRAALEQVMDKHAAKTLTKTAYSPRSTTAHAGRLHGLEPWFGTSAFRGYFSILRESGRLTFQHRFVSEVGQASRALVVKALDDGLESRKAGQV